MDSGTHPSRRAICAGLAVLLTIDLAIHFLTLSVGPANLAFDAGGYWAMGARVADGDWFMRHGAVNFRTPAYPWFLSLFRPYFGSSALLAVVVVQHILLMATSLIVGVICERIVKHWSGLLVGFGCSALCITRAWFGNAVLTETLFAFLLAFVVLALVTYHQRPSMWQSSLVGLTLGMCILVRPVPKLLWVPIVATILLQSLWGPVRRTFRQVLADAAVALLIMVFVIAPWLIRNQVVFGGLFVAKLPGWDHWQVCFLAGAGSNLPIPKGEAGSRLLNLLGAADGDLADREFKPILASLRNAGLTDEEIEELIHEVCWSAIRENPVQFGTTTIKRIVDYWRSVVNEFPYYGSEIAPYYAQQHAWRVAWAAEVYEPILRHTPVRSVRFNELMALLTWTGIAILLCQRRTRLIGCSLAMILLYFAAVTATAVIGNYMYRMVVEPVMIVSGVSGLLCLIHKNGANISAQES